MEVFHEHFIWIMWIYGWQWAATCGVCFSLTQLLQVIVLLSTGGANGGGYVLSKYALIGLQAIILMSLGFLNCLPVHYLAYIGNLAMVWNVLGKILTTPDLNLPPSLCIFNIKKKKGSWRGSSIPKPSCLYVNNDFVIKFNYNHPCVILPSTISM